MSLKFTTGRAGAIKYLGREVTVWKYDSNYTLKEEIDQLGRYLDEDSMAWVDKEFLVYSDKIVGKTTPRGEITWLREPADLPEEFRLKVKPQTSRGKRKEVTPVDDAADIEVSALWTKATRTDWEAIMVKTSW